MKRRSLAGPIQELAFTGHKIACVSGPRQCGKTTLAKMFLSRRSAGIYRNWDEIEFRRAWARNPSMLIPHPKGAKAPLIVLDEIHKDRRWKRNLKGLFDTLTRPCDILVTGSARLNVYMKGSDSLLGRHLTFRLHPFSLREMERPDVLTPDSLLQGFISRSYRHRISSERHLAALETYGPFPEPLLGQDMRKARLWRRNREQLIVREDLRDLSRIPELGRVEMLTALLPERIGSLAGLASIARDLEVSIPTIKRWLGYLKELYYLFEVKPYSRRIPRSLRREGKIYLWDYAIIQDPAARFENLEACHLLKTCHYWTDTGEGVFELFFLRNKDQREIDFLIVRDGIPWLPVEIKRTDTMPSSNWRFFASHIPCRLGLQIVRHPHWKMHEFEASHLVVVGAAEALAQFA